MSIGLLWILLINFILNEVLLRRETSEIFFGDGLLYIALFNLFIASLIGFILSFFNEKVQRRAVIIISVFITLIFYSQIIYDKLFRMYWTFYSFFHSAQVTEFMGVILSTLKKNWPIILYSGMILVLTILLLRKATSVKRREAIIAMVLSALLFTSFTMITKDNASSAYELTFVRPEIKATTYQTGLFSGMLTDTLQSLGAYYPKDLEIKRVDKEPNDKTGLFKDKNLIFITAESFSTLALHEKYTPTLYRLSKEGFQFEKYYNPLWEVSTTDGEYALLTGLMPVSGIWSLNESVGKSMPYAMGNQFKKIGYDTRAFHNYNYDYYNRDQAHPNLGYDWEGIGNGLEITKEWPASDLEMIEATVDSFIHEERFHTYYLTISAHMLYDDSSAMARKNIHLIEEDFPEDYKHYLAANIELDKAVAYLLKRLEEEGRLEDTVLCLSGDHYPYALSNKALGVYRTPEVYHSTLLLYHPSLKGEKVNKVMGSLDVLPTLLNLFDIDYVPSYYAGRDVFSDREGFVNFLNRSFITDKGAFNSLQSQWRGEPIEEDELEDYKEELHYRINLSEYLLREDGYKNLSD